MSKIRLRNPSDIQMRDGKLTDKYGRTFETNWKEFDKDRAKNRTSAPAFYSLKVK